ncbi:rab3 GTPase-activating protein catalytic subunit [Eupeodes corollae]|uniref:rab3 GTPase-activating protein catalytic subunit n=1 Tax=Eupeodes corollae TaxID=290404 RepID=UPI002491235F|nr:rab3 GTPase-activating protein catalytic subunit [Eupeodes corollae]
MAEEIDENGFYREDFSTKSDWESFNAQLGEIIQDWNLSAPDKGPPLKKDQLFNTNWNIKTETLKLGKKEFIVSYYQAEIPEDETKESTIPEQPQLFSDLTCLENTFCPSDTNDTHLLAKWYGLRRFILVEQAHGYISNTNDCSFFLSSANVVAAESNSAVPIFIPVFNPSWNFFLGSWVGQSVRINFDVVALENALPSCQYLSGLLNLFKEKRNGGSNRPATVSVRQTYALGNITKYTHKMKVPFFVNPAAESESLLDETPMEGTYFVALPYGYFSDSKTELLVQCCWPDIAENVALDTANYTDFVASKAHAWSVRAKTRARSYLSSALDDYLDLQKSIQTVESYVGRSYGSATGDEPNPLDQLTKSKFDVTASPFRKWSPQKKLAGPIKDAELLQMISYIFPDMQAEALFPYSKNAKNKFDPLRIKSAGCDSLVARLSCLLATCNAHFGGKSGMAQLWANFTEELRYRLDNCLQIPGIASGFPDMRTCLLHQKLQMLNICMERRRIRECGMPFASSEGEAAVSVLNPEDETQEDEATDDEFFDCSDEESTSSGPSKPQGRKSKLGDMKLIDSDEFLYVPATQDPVPKTEDQLLDDAEVMLKLGPGSGLSTQMMCSSLRSDMESFKAANPTAKIEDFIRWYSPRDWEEEIDEDGKVTAKLSTRMTAPDNTWQNVWKQAQPIPAYRQKRLFDDTNEALKVLHYLETRTIGELYELTVVALLHSAVLKLKDIVMYSNILEAFNNQIEEILSDLCKLSRDNDQIPDGSVFELLRKIQNLETSLFQYKNLEKLFPPQSPPNEKEKKIMVLSLGGDEVLLPGASKNTFARRILEKYRLEVGSSDSGKVLPDPASKEYVIRLESESSSSGPQFLRAISSGSRIRLCGAFSENTTFV